MSMPRFHAEASLYKTRGHYHMAATGNATAAGVLPQHFLGGEGQAFSPFGMGGLSIVGGFGGPGIMAISSTNCRRLCRVAGVACVALSAALGPWGIIPGLACIAAWDSCVENC